MKRKPIHFYIISIFPEAVRAYLDESIVGRAQRDRIITVEYYNPRDFVKGKRSKHGRELAASYRPVDGRPYGGGPGMVMKAEPILAAVAAIRKRARKRKYRVIIFSPHGTMLSSARARAYAERGGCFILIAGHYEGIDARVKAILHAEEMSIGPYVLTGGEIPSMAFVDSVTRFIPGALGKYGSLEEERIAARAVYTRPAVILYRGRRYRVPEVLRSGNHADIERWRKETQQRGESARAGQERQEGKKKRWE